MAKICRHIGKWGMSHIPRHIGKICRHIGILGQIKIRRHIGRILEFWKKFVVTLEGRYQNADFLFKKNADPVFKINADLFK